MKNNKVLVIIIIIAVVLIGLWLLNSRGKVYAPQETGEILPPPPIDESVQIDQDLNSIDLGDIEQDLAPIDNDLNNLNNPSPSK